MKRIINFLLLAALLSPATALAADVTVDGDVTLDTSYTLVNTSKFNTFTTDGTTWTASISDGSGLRIDSADKYSFTVSPATFSTTCNTSNSSIGISVPSGSPAQSFTITPSTTLCTATSNTGASGGGILYTTSGGGGGGSSGGGSSVSGSAIPQVTATAPTATPAAPSVAKPSIVAQTVSPVFNKNLVRGSRGTDVKRLQQLLKQDKTIYPSGVANGVYGPATTKAVKAFQKKYKLPQTGTLNVATRAKVQQVFGGAQVTAPTKAARPAVSTTAKARAAQIKTLQAQLKALQDMLKKLQK